MAKPLILKQKLSFDEVMKRVMRVTTKAPKIVSKDMTLYAGVRLTQLMEAIYEQGKKEGRRHAVETFYAASETLSYRNPGQPKKKKKPAKKK